MQYMQWEKHEGKLRDGRREEKSKKDSTNG